MNKLILFSLILTTVTMSACSKTEKSETPEQNTVQSKEAVSNTSNTASNTPLEDNVKPSAVALSNNKPVPEKCSIPDGQNSTLIEKMRPLILSFETYENDAIVSVKVNTKVKIDTTVEDGVQVDVEKEFKFYAEVDCDGDGVYEDKYDTLNNDNTLECTYHKKGVHQMMIRGEIPQMHVTYLLDNEDDSFEAFDLVSLDQWGDIQWKSMEDFFGNKDRNRKVIIKATDAPKLQDVCSMNSMFVGVREFQGSIENWDTSHVASMDSLFKNCTQLDQDLSHWDISSLRSAKEIFGSCYSEVICPKCDGLRNKLYQESQNRPKGGELHLSNDLFRDKQSSSCK